MHFKQVARELQKAASFEPPLHQVIDADQTARFVGKLRTERQVELSVAVEVVVARPDHTTVISSQLELWSPYLVTLVDSPTALDAMAVMPAAMRKKAQEARRQFNGRAFVFSLHRLMSDAPNEPLAYSTTGWSASRLCEYLDSALACARQVGRRPLPAKKASALKNWALHRASHSTDLADVLLGRAAMNWVVTKQPFPLPIHAA